MRSVVVSALAALVLLGVAAAQATIAENASMGECPSKARTLTFTTRGKGTDFPGGPVIGGPRSPNAFVTADKNFAYVDIYGGQHNGKGYGITVTKVNLIRDHGEVAFLVKARLAVPSASASGQSSPYHFIKIRRRT